MAAVRRQQPVTCMSGRAPPCGETSGVARLNRARRPMMRRTEPAEKARTNFLTHDAAVVLTMREAADYIGGSGARFASAVRRACEAPHDTRFHTRTRRPISVGSKELRRLSGFGEWSHPAPGCLTSESEERETWTAESLRAVRLLRAQAPGRRRPDETSAVHVSGQHQIIRASDRADDDGGTSSNVSDQPGKVLIQLESLILAQSERWRQA